MGSGLAIWVAKYSSKNESNPYPVNASDIFKYWFTESLTRELTNSCNLHKKPETDEQFNENGKKIESFQQDMPFRADIPEAVFIT